MKKVVKKAQLGAIVKGIKGAITGTKTASKITKPTAKIVKRNLPADRVSAVTKSNVKKSTASIKKKATELKRRSRNINDLKQAGRADLIMTFGIPASLGALSTVIPKVNSKSSSKKKNTVKPKKYKF